MAREKFQTLTEQDVYKRQIWHTDTKFPRFCWRFRVFLYHLGTVFAVFFWKTAVLHVV